jgi:HlyD family secretion protein
LKKKLIIEFIVILILLIFVFALWYFIGRNAADRQQVTIPVKKGDFNITLTTTGELQAKSCEYIYGPSSLKEAGIFQIKINDMIPEGTFLKKGDYVASLDPTEINSKIKELQEDIEKNQSLLSKTRLDTTFDLRNEKDKLASLKFSMEEAQVNLDQSKYEPPATIKQAEIELEKAKRAYNQSMKNYKLKTEQDKTKIDEINSAISLSRSKIDLLEKAQRNLSVRSPRNGIIIYKYEKGTEKITAGSVINLWNNIIATIPDLSQIISKTYVNEMDINKISQDMDAEVYIDAIPDKKFKGKVIFVASIGERLHNSETKVFEVKILVESDDPSLKPSMTTKNVLLVNTVKDVLFVPMECIHSENNMTIIYKSTDNRIVKAEVATGQSNDNDIIITKGLNENDVIFLTIPPDPDKLELKKIQ